MEDQNAKELHEQGENPLEEGEVLYEGEELTATDRILYTITAPKKAFQGLLIAKPGAIILVSLAVAVVLSIFSNVMTLSSDEVRDAIQKQSDERIERILDDPDLTDEEREAVESSMEAFGSPGGSILTASIGTIVFIPIGALVVALFVLLIAKVLESGYEAEVRYVHALMVASLGYVVFTVGGVIVAGILLLIDPGAVTLGFAGLIKSDSTILKSFVGALSPNMIWYYVVIGLGIAAIARTTVAKATLSFAVLMGAIFFGLIMIAQMFENMAF